MWAGEYQKMAMRTNDHRSWKRMSDFFMTPHQRFDEAQLGLSGETGDTDGIIKLKEVNNKMKDWVVVHSYIDGTPSIIKKDSITFVGTSLEGTTVIHTLNYTYEVSEKHTDIVRRIFE